MVDEHHAKQFFASAAIERLRKPRDLLTAEPSGRHEGSRCYRARQPDQRQRPASPQEWKPNVADIIIAHELAPMRTQMRAGAAHIDVMIAGHQRHVCRRPQRFEPSASRRVLAGCRDVDEIAGYRDVVGCACLQVRRHTRQHLGTMDEAAFAMPVEKAGRALAHKLRPMRPRQWREMRIRDMGEHEHLTLGTKVD